MKTLLLNVLLGAMLGASACSSSSPMPAEQPLGPEEAGSEPSAEPSAAASAGASTTPAPSTAPGDQEPASDGGRWTVEKGSAAGVSATNQVGKEITIGALSYTAFLRQESPIRTTEIAGANVKFGTVTADGLTVRDVVCRLAPWNIPEGQEAEIATSGKIVGYVATDAIAVAAAITPQQELKRCGQGIAPRVQWSFTGSVTGSVSVTGVSAAQQQCIAKAIRNAPAVDTGACAATLQL